MNVFMRIDFGSTIKLVSLDESQVVNFNGEFVCGFKNGDCGTESQSDNTVGSLYRFIINWIIISKSINEVTKVTDVENWRIDNSRVLRWIVSLFEWNSSVLSTKSSIQSSELGIELTFFASSELGPPNYRPPMFDRTDFASWQQRIQLYCQGKENRGQNDLESILTLHLKRRIGETIHDYYVRFAKLTNDMRDIKMTMSRMHLNSKFVNNMLPEWGRFVTAVKLNRGLRDSNYNMLYAYLKQHEHYLQSSTTLPSTYVQPYLADTTQLDSGFSPTATIQDGKVFIQNVQGRQNKGHGNNARGAGATDYGGAQNRVRYANPGQARQIKCYNCNGIGHIVRNCTQPKRRQNSEYFKDKMLLMQDQENGVTLDEVQLLFIAGGQDNVDDDDVDDQPIQDLALNVDNVFQADDCDAFDYDVDEAPLHKLCSWLISHSQILFMMKPIRLMIRTFYMSNMIPYDQYVNDNVVQVVQSDVSAVSNDAYMMILNDMHEPPAQHVYVTTHTKPLAIRALYVSLVQSKFSLPYNGHEIIKTDHVLAMVHNSEDTLEISEITKKKMNEKMKATLWTHHKINIKPPDYSKENFLATFTPQTQLTPEQIFWSKDVLKIKTEALKEQSKAAKPVKALTVNPPNTPVKLVPRVLPTKSQVKINIFALIQLFSEFENTCKKRITPTGLTEGEEVLNKQNNVILPRSFHFSKTLKEHFVAIFDELEAEVYQNVVHKKCDEIEQKNILIANDTLISNCLSKEVFYIAINSELNVSRFCKMHEAHTVVQAHSVTPKVLAHGMYVIEVEPLPPRLRNNREVHLDYLKHLKESVATLQEIEEEAKVEIPLDKSVAYTCLYTKHSQELLEYVIDTCPKDLNKRDKKQATTPLNRKKQVTFADQCETSNTNTQKHVEKQIALKTNVLVLPSTGVDSWTDASRSKPRSNTKKNRISPAKSVNKKTVEDHSRTNKSRLQKPNRVDSSISSKRTDINFNSDSVYKTCNKCFISANHDMCVIKYLNSMNAPSFTKNVMRKVKQVWKPKHVKQVWKAIGTMLTNVGYQWKRMGRIFTLGEQCPLTRYQRRNKQNKAVPTGIPTPTDAAVQSAVAYANQPDSNQNWGSNFPNSPSLSVFKCRSYISSFGYTMWKDWDTICFLSGNSDLEVAFRKHSCYVRDTDGFKLIKGSRGSNSRGSNLYTISVEDMMKSSPI
uniref:CCHC-type domain-containing protein n=1 Tax=Tanacetum cinerariifolium TaxID=118510 RepID=A0A6L2JF26_TANCI|nr:hypothetical protein [Tanacetum cinerariifolium]